MTDPEWRIMRRAVTEILKPQAVDRHLPIQYAESAQFMFDLMSKPEVSSCFLYPEALFKGTPSGALQPLRPLCR